MHSIHDMIAQGKSISTIAEELGISRQTVRKYRQGTPARKGRPARASKLAGYTEQIRTWVQEDHLYNCEVMYPRLQAQGYRGGKTLIKNFVQELRPQRAGRRPVQRYETRPGEQMQFDWGEFTYSAQGKTRKFYGFVAILGYSRMRFSCFVKRADAPTLIRCLMQAFEYFGGLPQAVLTDRMKSVLLDMEDGHPTWHPLFADFVASIGVIPRVCKPYTPQTKGKVERTVQVIKRNFWPGVTFTDLDDLNQQAHAWCVTQSQVPHATTHRPPAAMWSEEPLTALPGDWAWERFGAELRKVTWDGFVSYDGVLYGLPSEPLLAGTQVHVRERLGLLQVWARQQCVLSTPKRAVSGTIVIHPDQFRTIPSAAMQRRTTIPLGHQHDAPTVATRSLADYDQLCAHEVFA